jgi:hypothetical protein
MGIVVAELGIPSASSERAFVARRGSARVSVVWGRFGGRGTVAPGRQGLAPRSSRLLQLRQCVDAPHWMSPVPAALKGNHPAQPRRRRPLDMVFDQFPLGVGYELVSLGFEACGNQPHR